MQGLIQATKLAFLVHAKAHGLVHQQADYPSACGRQGDGGSEALELDQQLLPCIPTGHIGGSCLHPAVADEEAQAQATLAQSRTQGQGEGQLAVEAPKRNEQRRLAYTAMGNTRAAVKGARDLVSPLTTGIGGAVTGVIPGTSAVDLRKKIDTIKANLGFAELSAMRQSSPTGGALGQVAVQELEMLQSTVASLDTLQSSGALLEALNKVDQHLNNWQAAVDKAAARDGQSAPDPLGIR
mgnify:CR=1 FL=1